MLTILWLTFDDRLAALFHTPWLGALPLGAVFFVEIIFHYLTTLILFFSPRFARRE